jgi:hypothetical protein
MYIDRPQQAPPQKKNLDASVDQLGYAKNLSGMPGKMVPSWGVTVWILVRRMGGPADTTGDSLR